jgi:hypothetical protein
MMSSMRDVLRNALGLLAVIYVGFRAVEFVSYRGESRATSVPTMSKTTASSLFNDGLDITIPKNLRPVAAVNNKDSSTPKPPPPVITDTFVPVPTLNRTVASVEELPNGATEMMLIKAWKAGQATLDFVFPTKNTTPKSRYFITADVSIQRKATSMDHPEVNCIGTKVTVTVPAHASHSGNQSITDSACELQIGATIKGAGRIVFDTSSLLSSLPTKDEHYRMRYSAKRGTEITVLDFVEYPVSMKKTQSKDGKSSTATLVISWDIVGFNSYLLSEWDITILTTLTHVPSAFAHWDRTGISNGMINCAYFELSRSPYVIGQLHISNNGNNVRVIPSFDISKVEGNSSIPSRLVAIEKGFRMTVDYAKTVLKIKNFPDMKALIWPGDDARLPSAINSGMNTHCTNAGLPAPPIFAQNRAYSESNFVVMPDFSFFSDCATGPDHGSPEAAWFTALDKEARRFFDDSPTPYYPQDMEHKLDQVIYRGKFHNRDFAYLRQALTTDPKCGNLPDQIRSATRRTPFLNASGYNFISFIRREEMCRDYAGLLTLPGNGVWSWASKFNLVRTVRLALRLL